MTQQLLVPRSALPVVVAHAPGGPRLLERLGIRLETQVGDLQVLVSEHVEPSNGPIRSFLGRVQGILSTAHRCAQLSSGSAGQAILVFAGLAQSVVLLLGPEALSVALVDQADTPALWEKVFAPSPGTSVRVLFCEDGEPVEARIYQGDAEAT
jgi:hypothetical protein